MTKEERQVYLALARVEPFVLALCSFCRYGACSECTNSLVQSHGVIDPWGVAQGDDCWLFKTRRGEGVSEAADLTGFYLRLDERRRQGKLA